MDHSLYLIACKHEGNNIYVECQTTIHMHDQANLTVLHIFDRPKKETFYLSRRFSNVFFHFKDTESVFPCLGTVDIRAFGGWSICSVLFIISSNKTTKREPRQHSTNYCENFKCTHRVRFSYLNARDIELRSECYKPKY